MIRDAATAAVRQNLVAARAGVVAGGTRGEVHAADLMALDGLEVYMGEVLIGCGVGGGRLLRSDAGAGVGERDEPEHVLRDGVEKRGIDDALPAVVGVRDAIQLGPERSRKRREVSTGLRKGWGIDRAGSDGQRRVDAKTLVGEEEESLVTEDWDRRSFLRTDSA